MVVRGYSLTLLPYLRVTRPILLLHFPLSDALLAPDRPHSKLAVGTRYAAEIPSREVGEHGVTLEAQPPAQGCGVEDLVDLRHLYPVKICLLHHERHHTEIIDESGGCVNKTLIQGMCLAWCDEGGVKIGSGTKCETEE